MPRIRNRKSKSKQRGGKMVLPPNYFNVENTGNYTENVKQCGSSYGSVFNNNMTGGLTPTINQQGGGPLPAAYFGGNNDGYYEAGAPELQPCTSPYGVNLPTSHGVVLDQGAEGMWMGPNLGPGPNAVSMTGGAKRRLRRRKTNKRKVNRRINKRRINKRKTNKRKTNKRKTNKRKSNKRTTNKRK